MGSGQGYDPEIFVVRGVTDNSATTGACSLNSDLFQAAVTFFRIPRGMQAKIWARSGVAEGFATKFTIEHAPDGSTYKELDRLFILATTQDGVGLERRKPLILRAFDGDETFKIAWSQATAALAYITIIVEITHITDKG